MSDIVAFITARLDDLEGFLSTTPDEVEWIGDRFVAIRTLLLADVEAKRRIVDLHSPPKGYQASPFGPEDTEPPFYEPEPWQANQCGECGYMEEWQAREYGATFPCRTLRLLALPYADHPDYREEWKP